VEGRDDSTEEPLEESGLEPEDTHAAEAAAKVRAASEGEEEGPVDAQTERTAPPDEDSDVVDDGVTDNGADAPARLREEAERLHSEAADRQKAAAELREEASKLREEAARLLEQPQELQVEAAKLREEARAAQSLFDPDAAPTSAESHPDAVGALGFDDLEAGQSQDDLEAAPKRGWLRRRRG
jgi:chromosome segregation ATPase